MSTTITAPRVVSTLGFNGSGTGSQANTSAAIQSTQNRNVAVGTSPGSIDSGYTSGQLNVISGTPQTITIDSLVDPLGNSITIGHLGAIQVLNLASNAAGQNLEIALSGQATLSVGPGGQFIADYAADDIAAPTLTLTSSTNTIGAVVTLIGRST